jgi:hypothetical protein
MDQDQFGNEVEFFLCDCTHAEHTLRANYNQEWNTLNFDIFLATHSWYKRVWYGLKYMFGFKSKYGHFTDIVFSPKDCDRLIALMSRMKARDIEITAKLAEVD